MGSHHRHYRGEAFFMQKGDAVRFPVNGRIMNIDSSRTLAYFGEGPL